MSRCVHRTIPSAEATEFVRMQRRVLDVLAEFVERPVRRQQRWMNTQLSLARYHQKLLGSWRGGLEVFAGSVELQSVCQQD